jgi:hypothetical protein
MTTISLTGQIVYADALSRRLGPDLSGCWAITNTSWQTIQVANDTTISLPVYATYLMQADPLGTVVFGFTISSTVVELPINVLSAIQLPSGATGPYLRNTQLNTSTNAPVPVTLFAFT